MSTRTQTQTIGNGLVHQFYLLSTMTVGVILPLFRLIEQSGHTIAPPIISTLGIALYVSTFSEQVYNGLGRVIHRMVILYTSLEDLITENNCRYEEGLEENTAEQDRLQHGYIVLMQVLPWLHAKLGQLDINKCQDMLKQLKRGVDAAHGDDTSTLKDLVASWINQDFQPSSLLKSDNKLMVKAGIRDRTVDYIVSENSWLLFLYEKYTVSYGNLEQGLFKSKILVQAFKAIFTSPSSAREADGDSDGADILKNNSKVTPCSIAYVVCQVHFALSNISSWCTIYGDFDYEAFWNNVVDFFKDLPGPVAQSRVNQLLEWWTRKVFGNNHRQDLTPEVVSHMSVTTLAQQRKALEDAVFDSD
ncbi:uncharacterized protein EDB93DRAFT_1245778 [Suillus bovinus]|uniref:uncharacterized protein n=1 Tax=Suillus bovinus TaxID=48563 RepID=UPI001B868632|nr:uncharacterized protein EDB93DRAFT_1245778 [Suillus bovinus]KAG2158549.1 hypothetical protein EDB93DRAFT_1245778 [Suillus bovinus]